MPWGRMDDSFHDHPKVEELSLEAVGLWAKCWSKALGQVKAVPTERRGFVSEATARGFGGSRTKRLVAELTRVMPGKAHGMWESAEGGWMIHDFADYLPKQRDPAEAAASGRKGAAAKWGGRQVATSHSSSQADSQDEAIATGMAVDGSRASRSAFPTRPVPEEPFQDLGGQRPETLGAPAETPPPNDYDLTRCSAHQGVASPPPCAGCRAARERTEKARDRNEDRERDRRQRELEAARNACTRCDGTWITDTDGKPTKRKCDHRRTA